MSTNTSNFNLIKPELTDAADITAYNSNWDTIDTELHSLNEVTDTHGEQLNAINQELAVMDDRHSKLNLLYNSNFRNPVNQRGAIGEIPAWTYHIDGWRTSGKTATIGFGDDGLICTGYMSQTVVSNCDGKTVTFAVKINGEVFCCSTNIYDVTEWVNMAHVDTNVGQIAICKYDTDELYVEINNTTQGTIEWAALYEGAYTVETLPPYAPKDFEVERLSCNGGASNSFKGTLTSSGWSASAPFTQTITVQGILATDEPFVDVDLSSVSNAVNVLEAWSVVGRLTASANNTITAYCYEEKPTVNIPILLKVVR